VVSDLGRIDIDEGALEPHGSRPRSFSGVNLNPVKTYGTLVIQESTVTGVAGEEMWIELKDNLVAAIGGGEAARQLQLFAPGGYYVRHADLVAGPDFLRANTGARKRFRYSVMPSSQARLSRPERRFKFKNWLRRRDSNPQPCG
jgi:hypothetical protein